MFNNGYVSDILKKGISLPECFSDILKGGIREFNAAFYFLNSFSSYAFK